MSCLKTSIFVILFSAAAQLIAVPAVLEEGDLAIVGVNANNGTCSGSSGEDLVSFVCFKDITMGTTLDFTDNGWERLYAGFWGTTEGVIRITRTGGTITAGTVVTIRFNNLSASGVSPDANWSSSSLNGASQFNLNTSGDQIYVMQGGTWINGGTHLGTYDGTVLFGLSTTGSWATFTGSNLGTQQSVVYPGMPCLSLAPTASTDWSKFDGNGDLSPTTQRIWLDRISDSNNWTDYFNCTFYNAVAPVYQTGYTLSITAGGFREGYWLGVVDNDWSDCQNWESLRVPDDQTDVVLQPLDGSVGPFVHAFISNTGNQCRSLSIWSGALLSMNGTGALTVYEDVLNNGTLSSSGTITLTGNVNTFITGSSGFPIRTLNLNKFGGADIFTDTTITITNLGALNFTNGIIYPLSADPVIFNTNAGANGASNSSYVEGVVRKIGSDDFDFPVGDGFYQPIGIENIGSAGSEFEAEFIDANGPGIYSYNWVGSINNVATCSYWMLNRNSGTTARVRLSWGNDADCVINTVGDLVVSRFDGAIWQDHGQLSSTGNATAGTILSNDLINSFSPFALASRSTDNPLPVEWLNFQAELSGSEDVKLDWSTATEINNDYFSVEHSRDGIHYSELAQIKGAGNSNQQLNYNWLHKSAPPGSNYYRISQTDYDGTVDYSPTRHVRVDATWQAFVSNGSLELRSSDQTSNVVLRLFDTAGRSVINRTLGQGNAFSVNLQHLSRGVYVVQVTNQGKEPFRTRVAY